MIQTGSDGAWHNGVPSVLLMCCFPPAQRMVTPVRMRRSQSSAWLQMAGECPAQPCLSFWWQGRPGQGGVSGATHGTSQVGMDEQSPT